MAQVEAGEDPSQAQMAAMVAEQKAKTTAATEAELAALAAKMQLRKDELGAKLDEEQLKTPNCRRCRCSC